MFKIVSILAKMCRKPKNYVMNDDILTLILDKLSVKQLLRLESVSQQFRDCVGEALKRKTGLRIGQKFQNLRCSDCDHSVIGGSVRTCAKVQHFKHFLIRDLVSCIDSFAAILKRCPNIRALYLSECAINVEVVKKIVYHCKRLKCLTLVGNFCTSDLREWQLIAELLAPLKLVHLIIVGHCYEVVDNPKSIEVKHFAKQVDCMVQRMPFLEKLVLFWYDQPFDELFPSLPKSLKSLRVIRCSRLSMSDLVHLHQDHLPNLKELEMDLNFYGRNKENPMFEFFCRRLSLDKLIFFVDCPLSKQVFDSLTKSKIKSVCLKFYERRFKPNDYLELPSNKSNHNLKSLSLHNFLIKPHFMKQLAKCFPSLKLLEMKKMSVFCQCEPDSESDNDSLVSGIFEVNCQKCNSQSMQCLSQMKHLKHLRLYRISKYNLDYLKRIDNLMVLEFPEFVANCWAINDLCRVSVEICQSKPKGLSLMFAAETSDHFYKALHDFTKGFVPNNLRIRTKAYPKPGYHQSLY